MTLTEQALRLKYSADRALMGAAAMILPPHVRELIEMQAELLVEIARELERRKDGK